MRFDYFTHHFRIRKGDVVKIAPSEEWIGQILFGIGGNDDHRSVFGLYGFVDFDNIKLHLIQNIQHIILKVGVCFVDLVDQENGSGLSGKRATDFSHADIRFDVADISF